MSRRWPTLCGSRGCSSALPACTSPCTLPPVPRPRQLLQCQASMTSHSAEKPVLTRLRLRHLLEYPALLVPRNNFEPSGHQARPTQTWHTVPNAPMVSSAASACDARQNLQNTMPLSAIKSVLQYCSPGNWDISPCRPQRRFQQQGSVFDSTSKAWQNSTEPPA